MSYKVDKFFKVSLEDNPSAQTISTSYAEITGSRCEVNSINSTKNLIYKFSFLSSSVSNAYFLHIKLQKSNDNFSSNIEDIPGCMINISGDTKNPSDDMFKTCSPFFVLENFDSKYLRLVVRSYSTSTTARLHTVNKYDGGTPSNIYFNTSLIVMEI